MKIPRIYQALTASLFVHLSFLAVAVFVISRVSDYRHPSPYIVSLVDDRLSPAPAPGPASSREPAARKSPEPPKSVKQSAPAPAATASARGKAHQAEQDKLMKERIEALEAKKRIEKLVTLRKVIEVDASKPSVAKTPSKSSPQKPDSSQAPGPGAAAQGGRDYYTLVVGKIHEQWDLPPNKDYKDLEAVVAIRIARDGRVTIDRIEKSSGNSLFDRSVVRAINLASPLPPPPQDMDIGVRFRP